jgi:hypothetical protein
MLVRTIESERGQEDYDKLFKVREVLDILSESFRNGYTLSRETSVDEA